MCTVSVLSYVCQPFIKEFHDDDDDDDDVFIGLLPFL